jgi:hypothetical protein
MVMFGLVLIPIGALGAAMRRNRRAPASMRLVR